MDRRDRMEVNMTNPEEDVCYNCFYYLGDTSQGSCRNILHDQEARCIIQRSLLMSGVGSGSQTDQNS